MVDIIYADRFKKILSKIKDGNLKERIAKQVAKIIKNPEIGKEQESFMFRHLGYLMLLSNIKIQFIF